MNTPVVVLETRLGAVKERLNVLHREIDENNMENLNKKGIIVDEEQNKIEIEDAIRILKAIEIKNDEPTDQ